ncbi:MAG: hypothetical protein EZS28_028223, partial [Streblomastix strix]
SEREKKERERERMKQALLRQKEIREGKAAAAWKQDGAKGKKSIKVYEDTETPKLLRQLEKGQYMSPGQASRSYNSKDGITINDEFLAEPNTFDIEEELVSSSRVRVLSSHARASRVEGDFGRAVLVRGLLGLVNILKDVYCQIRSIAPFCSSAVLYG